MLLNKMLDECKKRQIKYVMLEVRATNFSAQKLYLKHGFKEEVIRKNYYKNPDNTREDAIVMGMEM